MVKITKAILYPPQPIIKYFAMELIKYGDYLAAKRAKLLLYIVENDVKLMNITTFLS